MAPVHLLKLDGIPGELELESVAWSESGTARGEPATISFIARASAASAALFLACADGRKIASAVLTVLEGEDRRQPGRKWTFTDVSVSSYSTAGGPEGPVDQVVLRAELVEALPQPRPPTLRLRLVRADDLLNLEIATVNLRVDGEGDDRALVVDDAASPGQLSVGFPPQTIAETAYFRSSAVPEVEPAPGERPFDPPGATSGSPILPRDSAARVANPSRLVFEVPPGTRLPLTVAGLLDWSELDPAVSPIAAIPPDPSDEEIAAAPAIRAPEAGETALELPYRLVISPNREVEWEHRDEPFTSRGRTELWHTRLTSVPLRAIWSPDYSPFDPPAPADLDPNLGLTAMAPNDRHQLVILTSAFHGYENEVELSLAGLANGGVLGSGVRILPLTFPYVPAPFEAESLMLSPLGGWMRSRGHWNPPRQVVRGVPIRPDLPGIFASTQRAEPELLASQLGIFTQTGEQLDLSEWVHVAAQGRDHYVRIVYEGELKPFGNKAALVKVTERRFMELEGGLVAAYHVQQMFVVVREPVRSFARNDRGMLYKKVELTTLVTPPIAFPDFEPDDSRSFWVKVNTGGPLPVPFMFHGVGTDVTGEDTDFTVPMMFVSIADTGATLKKVLANYNKTTSAADLAARDLRIPGQPLAFAEPDEADPSKQNSVLVAESLNFVVDPDSGEPRVLKADVRIPQVQELLGTEAATTIRLFEGYVAGGLDPTSGVFAEIAKPDFTQFSAANPLGGMVAETLGVDFSSDKAGGFATPNLGVSTLTRDLGPLAGDVADAVTGTFDPAKFFGSGLAMLFGSFDLAELLPTSTLGENAPKLRTGPTDTTIDWEPAVEDLDAGVVTFEKDHGGQTKLEVHGVIKRPVGTDPPEFSFDGKLNAFQVGVLGSVFVNFDEFRFKARSEQKPDVSVALDPGQPVQFAGDLEFVEELRSAIPPGLFGDGPSLDVSPTGIRAGFGIALPPVAVGVFALKDVYLGAALTLPFVDGKPVFDFEVSRRDQPFLVSVAIFGGGGFFHLQLDTAGMKELEAAIEFGATAALDIGVASGSVHMMAGIYFSLERRDPGNELAATLTGYLRVGGSLSVLGLITISVEFNLSFTYAEVGKAYGRATLTVEVEIAFFSTSVELTVERTFGGESGDPKFVEAFTTADTWSDYATAFA